MAKIVKNTTIAAINVSDVGVTIAASPGSYTIPDQDYLIWSASTVAATNVGTGDLVVNDGTSDLSAALGAAHLKGGEANTASNLGAGSQSFKSKTGSDLQFRSVIGGTGILATQNTNDITLTSVANTSTQKVEVVKNSGAVVGTRKQLNFIEGSSISLTVADDAGNDQVDITITSTASGSGDVVGPASSNAGEIVLFDGLTGKLIKAATGSGVVFAASGVYNTEANLDVTRGGTGLGTLTANNLIIGAGTSDVTFIAPGTSGNVLQSNGTVFQSVTLATAGIATNDLSYITMSAEASLTNERRLLGTTNQVVVTDNGAGTSVTLSLPQNIHTGATPQFVSVLLSGITAGSIPFANGSSVLIDNNSQLSWNNTNNTLLIGNTQASQVIDGGTETSRISLESVGAANAMDLFVHRHAATSTFKSDLALARSRGSAASPSAIQVGDYIGAIDFFGHDGVSSWRYAAQIRSEIDSGTVSATSMPGLIRFLVTPDTTIVPSEALKIASTKIITMAGYGTGISHFSSAGVISSSLIVNADVSASAAIDYSKLATLANGNVIFGNTGNISTALNTIAVTSATGTANQVTVSASVGAVTFSTPQNIHTAATPTFAGLTLSGFASVGIVHNAAGGLLSSSLIVNADIDAAAAIARSKIAVGTADHVVINSGTGALSSEANLAVSRGGTGLGTLTANNVILGAGTSAVTFVAPSTSGNILTSNGTTWTSAAPAASPIAIGSTVTSGTTGSILFIGAASALAQDNANLFFDDTNNRLGLGTASPTATFHATSAVGTGTQNPVFKLVTPAHTALTASTEYVTGDFNGSATIQFTAGALTTNRSFLFQAPTLTSTGIMTVTTAATMAVTGPPQVSGALEITTGVGLYVENRTVAAGVLNAIGLLCEAPTVSGSGTGAAACFTTTSAAKGVLGICNSAPRVFVDFTPNVSNSNPTVINLGGAATGAAFYANAEAVTTPIASTGLMVFDFALNPVASSSSNATSNFNFMVLKGTNNFTGQPSAGHFQTRAMTTSGTITGMTAVRMSVLTDSTSTNAITTARGISLTTSLAGTNTITTLAHVDLAFSGTAAGTTTDYMALRINNGTVSGGHTLTNYCGLMIEDMTGTVGTNKLAIRSKGSAMQVWIRGDTSLGQDSAPGATLDVAGKFFVAGATGLITKYNNITTASCGVKYIVGVADLTGQTAAKGATNLYTPIADGVFEVTCTLKVTTAATSSSTLGACTITYTSADGSVAQSIVMGMNTAAGAYATTSTTNSTTTSTLSGKIIISAKSSVAIQYAIAYVSSGATPMAYSAHLVCIAC